MARESKISGCCKNNTSVVLQQCQNLVITEGKGSHFIFKLSAHLMKRVDSVVLRINNIINRSKNLDNI